MGVFSFALSVEARPRMPLAPGAFALRSRCYQNSGFSAASKDHLGHGVHTVAELAVSSLLQSCKVMLGLTVEVLYAACGALWYAFGA